MLFLQPIFWNFCVFVIVEPNRSRLLGSTINYHILLIKNYLFIYLSLFYSSVLFYLHVFTIRIYVIYAMKPVFIYLNAVFYFPDNLY